MASCSQRTTITRVADSEESLEGQRKRLKLALQSECTHNELTSADLRREPRTRFSSITQDMRDTNRFNCYESSIDQHRKKFKGKNVLLIGTGNGLLALFAARAAAKLVVMYDRRGAEEFALTVVNNNKTKFINSTEFRQMSGDIESVRLPNGLMEVDIIVSDWIDDGLFVGSMVKTFIIARNRWLKWNGSIYPSGANFTLLGASDLSREGTSTQGLDPKSLTYRQIERWNEKFLDCDLSEFKTKLSGELILSRIDHKQYVTNECTLKYFDLYKISVEDLNFDSKVNLICNKRDYLQMFVINYNVIFGNTIDKSIVNRRDKIIAPFKYGTAAENCNRFLPLILLLEQDRELAVNDKNRIYCKLSYRLTCDCLRTLDIDIEYEHKENPTKRVRNYVLNK